jgi:hypothetical protein
VENSALERWMAGGSLEGVGYALNDAVVVLEGEHAGQAGAVVALQSLAPEPLYLVELRSGEHVGALQSSLRPAG